MDTQPPPTPYSINPPTMFHDSLIFQIFNRIFFYKMILQDSEENSIKLPGGLIIVEGFW